MSSIPNDGHTWASDILETDPLSLITSFKCMFMLQDEISVDCLDFNKKILHTAWHPHESIIAVAATNNLFIFQDKF
ncbi:unnamed protein product [Leptidea sinapis]|uniref:Uncharacterized protein n=1 Tax=Leptidea sinapis TaxID=189913 RepID=A0A5E4PYJ9_9NEOP|nr:unnamed protein product [Leptidea sinapis]